MVDFESEIIYNIKEMHNIFWCIFEEVHGTDRRCGMERTGTNSNMSLRAKLIWIVLVAFFLAASFMVASTVYSLRLVEEQTSTAYKEIVNTYLERVVIQ